MNRLILAAAILTAAASATAQPRIVIDADEYFGYAESGEKFIAVSHNDCPINGEIHKYKNAAYWMRIGYAAGYKQPACWRELSETNKSVWFCDIFTTREGVSSLVSCQPVDKDRLMATESLPRPANLAP